MEETVERERDKFFRPKRRGEDGVGEGFKEILKKAFRVAIWLLLLTSFLFVGHGIYASLLEDPWLRVREVEIEGCHKISREMILSLAKLEGMPNLFTVRLEEVAKRLASYPWIEQVRLRKVFPDKMLIQIEERRPVAIIQLEELYYLDGKGVIFSPVEVGDKLDYPILTGVTPQALEKEPAEAKRLILKAIEFLRIVDEVKLSFLEEISEIRIERVFGIECITRAEGVEIRLGWEHFAEKLKRLSLIWSDLHQRGCSAASIDCSSLKSIVVKKIPR
jgi:cell division protein FtsQ